MRFEDVTARLGAPLNYPNNPDDGLPLNVAIPHMGDVRLWQAVYGGYTWAIMYEPGIESWPESEKIKWVGYTASYRKLGQTNSSQTIRIDGAPWDSFAKAEAACNRTWKQIRNAA